MKTFVILVTNTGALERTGFSQKHFCLTFSAKRTKVEPRCVHGKKKQ